MRKIQKLLLMTLLAVFCFLGGLTSAITTSVLADGTLTHDTFVMQNGASVRLETLKDADGNPIESNGLRFCAEISADEYNALKQAGARFGAVIVAKDLLKNTEINETTVFGETPSFYFTNEANGDTSKIAMLHIANAGCQNIDTDDNIEICGSIVNIQVNNFTRSFIGRVYVAIPSVNAETGETEYSYHFAPYADGDIANNTRSIYYVAQREIELQTETATAVTEKYILPFSQTDKFTKYEYRYFVEHHYVVHDENDQHVDTHVEVTEHYAPLNSDVTAEPIEKPNVEALENHSFIFDVAASEATRDGLVYPAGMQRLKLYYESAETISEDHKEVTLETLLADFLDINKASENFGLHVNGDGYEEDWEAAAVMSPDDPEKQIGISLTATEDATKNRHLLLSEHFFDQLRAFGVESLSFDFHGTGNKYLLNFMMYQEETPDEEIPVYNAETGELLPKKTYYSPDSVRIKLYLKDITPGGGVLIELATNSSSNTGCYHIGNMEFHFPTQSL